MKYCLPSRSFPSLPTIASSCLLAWLATTPLAAAASPPAPPEIVGFQRQPNGSLAISVTPAEGTYDILRRGTRFQRWLTRLDVRRATPGIHPLQLIDPFLTPPSTLELYVVQRVALDHPLDLDNDGLDDAFELRHPDLFDPLVPNDPQADPDGDGLTHFQESLLGTHPGAVDPTLRVLGRILWPDGSPVAQAEVIAYDHPLNPTLTDDQGRFEFLGVRIGSHPLRLGASKVVDGRRHRALARLNLAAHTGSSTDADAGDLRLEPLSMPPLPTAAAGFGHTLVIKTDGSLWGWGVNRDGALAQPIRTGTITNPIPILPDTRWKTIASCSTTRTVGIRDDGSLWQWGNTQFEPSQVGQDTDWTRAVTGDNHGVALKQDGSLWTWGSNFNGVLGDGTFANKLVPDPFRAGGDHVWVDIAAYATHTVALRADGTLWSWGANSDGRLGTGDRVSRNVLTQVGTRHDWRGVAAGCFHTLALREDGSLWAWGDNTYRQLGDGSNTRRLDPVRIGSSTRWTTLNAALFHSAALRDDGTLWVWGENRSGFLGFFGQPGSTPSQTATSRTWTSAQLGPEHTLALSTDGQLWIWGNPNDSRLGLPGRPRGEFPQPLNPDLDWKHPTP